MRYVVTELEGFLQVGGRQRASSERPGLSCTVIDTQHNCRVMKTFRSEDESRGPLVGYGQRQDSRERARKRATEYAAKLNDGETPPRDHPYAPHLRSFRPTCPRCSHLCDLHAIWCAECGTRLYPAWSGLYGDKP